MAQGRDYCSELVRGRDEDRWLAAQYASENAKRSLIALYAFQCELRRIPSAVSEPPLGEIRLQWWREALQEIRDGKPVRAHPVVEEIAAAEILKLELTTLYDGVIDAAARPLYGEGFADIDDLTSWLTTAEGAFDELAVLLMGGEDAISKAVRQAGAAFALAREGKGLAAHLADDLRMQAREMWAETRPLLRATNAATTPAILHLSLTPSYLRKENPFPIAKRARLFTAMAFGM